MEAIVQPLTIKGKTMKNRIVVAPAERVGLTYTDNIMGADVIREYETLAENNAGLIMTQSLVVAPEDAVAVDFPLPGIWEDTHIEPLKQMSRPRIETERCSLRSSAWRGPIRIGGPRQRSSACGRTSSPVRCAVPPPERTAWRSTARMT